MSRVGLRTVVTVELEDCEMMVLRTVHTCISWFVHFSQFGNMAANSAEIDEGLYSRQL